VEEKTTKAPKSSDAEELSEELDVCIVVAAYILVKLHLIIVRILVHRYIILIF